MRETRTRFDSLVGWTVSGTLLTGFLAFVAAVWALFVGEAIAVGACLVAASLAFGLLCNALLRT